MNWLDETMAYDSTGVAVTHNGIKEEFKNPYDAREKVERILEKELGFFSSLQEDIEEGEFIVYLHTDTFDDVDDEEIDILANFGISECGEETTAALKEKFGIEFEVLEAIAV